MSAADHGRARANEEPGQCRGVWQEPASPAEAEAAIQAWEADGEPIADPVARAIAHGCHIEIDPGLSALAHGDDFDPSELLHDIEYLLTTQTSNVRPSSESELRALTEWLWCYRYTNSTEGKGGS